MEIVETAVVSKTGRKETCEDSVYAGKWFAAVIDGATTKDTVGRQPPSPGRLAADRIASEMVRLPPGADCLSAANRLSEAVLDLCRTHGRTLGKNGPSASAVIFNRKRHEIWLVGDCQAMVDGDLIRFPGRIDQIAAEARALFLELEVAAGRTIEALRAEDTGREFIRPILERQILFQNADPDCSLSYSVIDGRRLSKGHIRVHAVPRGTKSIVLASDGYPRLRGTLEQSEAELGQLLEADPLCFRANKGTKGVGVENLSYDDRAYLRLELG